MQVHLHNPKRDVMSPGPLRVNNLVKRRGLTAVCRPGNRGNHPRMDDESYGPWHD